MCAVERDTLLHVAGEVLDYSRAHDYAGYSKHDALNSPFLSALFGWSRLTRLVAIQAVMRFSLNTRPLLGVPRLRNPKGIGLFAHTLLDLYEVLNGTDTTVDGMNAADCLKEAESLLQWLVANASPWTTPSAELLDLFAVSGAEGEGTCAGLGWGYHYDWQDVGFFQRRHFPNRVVSCWIGFAFLRAAALTGGQRYVRAAEEIARFLLENPRRLVDEEDMLCLSYVPVEEIDWAVMDVSALVASFCAQLAAMDEVSNASVLQASARRLIRFVVDKQTDYGAWFYTWPADDSHITHDNYHTGIILDCLADYMEAAGEREWEPVYRDGLSYYREHLFEADGAPRWMNDKAFPRDTHGAAAGILCFTHAAHFLKENTWVGEADRVLQWTLDNLYSGRGTFYYQQSRCFTKRFCLMRWCNAWMSRALAQRLAMGQSMDA